MPRIKPSSIIVKAAPRRRFFNQSELYFNYFWHTTGEPDDPRVSGKPDSTLFSRDEGFEMLYLINYFMEHFGLKEKRSGEKAEKLLRKHLPKNIYKQDAVLIWLRKNWNNSL